MAEKVNLVWRSDRPRVDVEAFLTGSVFDALRSYDYRFEPPTAMPRDGQPGTEWVAIRKGGPSGVWLVSILLWWLVPNTRRAVFWVGSLVDGRTELLAAGDLPNAVARTLRQLSEPPTATA
jgi:hypothetical protein